MRSILFVAFALLIALAAGPAHALAANDIAKPAKQKSYALVAAIGDQFSVVSEEESTGSRLRGYKRSTQTAPDNLLNVLALQGLEKVVAQLDPGSNRTYLALNAIHVEKAVNAERGAAMIAKIQSQLAGMPQRKDWDLILVAIPAYQRFEIDGMASKLEGFGVFTEPLQGGTFSHSRYTYDLDLAQRYKADALTPENKEIRSKTYAAPFSYVEVWVLDAKDLSVIDKQKSFRNQKLANPGSGTLDINQSVSKEFMAKQMIALVEGSVREAVMRSDANRKAGEVEIGQPREIKPGKPAQ
jgi:hypothetical protein